MTNPDAQPAPVGSEDDIRDRLVAMTRDLILVPSHPGRPNDRRRCHELVKNHLDALGAVEVREFEEHGSPSLVAMPKGCRVPEVLFCAHLDVITHPDIGFYKSEIRDGRIIGPGAGDMKGALAILLDLFRQFHHRHPGLSLGMAVTSDEETGGEYGIGYLAEQRGLRCGVAIIPDGGSLNDITVEEKGILHLRAMCRGQPAHAARPWLGRNPIPRLTEALGRLQHRFQNWTDAASSDHWYPTCAVTVIGTENQTINRIPGDARASLDVRFPPPFTRESILQEIEAALGPDVHLEIVVGAEPTHLLPDPLYARVIEEVTGRAAMFRRECGGSDARFLCRHDIPVLMSRPLVGNLHAADEWIDIASMVQFHRIIARYLEERLQWVERL